MRQVTDVFLVPQQQSLQAQIEGLQAAAAAGGPQSGKALTLSSLQLLRNLVDRVLELVRAGR